MQCRKSDGREDVVGDTAMSRRREGEKKSRLPARLVVKVKISRSDALRQIVRRIENKAESKVAGREEKEKVCRGEGKRSNRNKRRVRQGGLYGKQGIVCQKKSD